MKVRVIPVKPIPGILPKNKWIDTEMELDLNKNEIMHCMKFGNVYDASSDKLIDSISIKTLFEVPKTIKQNYIAPVKKEVPQVEAEIPVFEKPVVPAPVIAEPIVEVVEEVVVEEPTPVVVEDIVKEAPYYELEVVSCSKDDEYITLETQMNTNSKLEGNLYGLFSINSGSRPMSIEYLLNNNWVKFSNKFANFESINNGDKFVFRFVPKNESEFNYRLLIKEANDVLAKLESGVNPSAL